MSKTAIVFTVIVILAVHVLVLFLALSPGSPASSAPDQTGTEDVYVPPAVDPTPDVPPTAGPVTVPPVVQPGPAAVPEKTVTPASAETQIKRVTGKKYTGMPKDLDRRSAVLHPNGPPQMWKGTAKRATGILVDMDNRKVLWQKDSLKQVPIASLTKIMTLLLVYEDMLKADADLHLNSPIQITPEARAVPPSGVRFQPAEQSFPVEKLMLAAAIRSANDATHLLAQAFGNGSAQTFINRMNTRARELGMENTVFYNAHGLPGGKEHPDNKSTVTDLVRACEVFLTYPELREWSSMRIGTFRTKNDLVNHNHLLPGGRYSCQGVSGIKTGFTLNAGFCVAAVCTRNDRTLLAIVTGFGSAKERDGYVKNLLNWGFKRIAQK